MSAYDDSWYYDGYRTPSIHAMSNYASSFATPVIRGRIMADSIDSINIKIGKSVMDVGTDEDEINGDLMGNSNYQPYKNRFPIYYRVPSDLEGGFYNLTMQIENLEAGALVGTGQYGSVGNGYARMYPERDSYSDGYKRDNFFGRRGNFVDSNFKTNMEGRVFSMCLFPTIHELSYTEGSAAGGQVYGHD